MLGCLDEFIMGRLQLFPLNEYKIHSNSGRGLIILLATFLLAMGFVLLYPFRTFKGFSQIDPLRIVPDPLLFSMIFSLVLANYLLMMYFYGNRKWSPTFVLFVSIAFGLLTYKMEPLGVDHEYGITLADTAYLGTFHHFSQPLPSNVGYLGYPGISILTYSVSKIFGVNYISSASILQLFLYLLCGLSFYILTLRLVHQPFLASLSTILFFAFSLEAVSLTLFFPATLGFTYFALAITLIRPSMRNQSLLILTLLYSAMTVTHFYDPLDLTFILGFLSLPILAVASRNFLRPFLISLLIFVLYLTFMASNYFDSLVPVIYQTLAQLAQFHSLSYALQVAAVNTFGVPLWVAFIRYFDIFVTSVVGAVFALWYSLAALRHKSSHSIYVHLFSVMALGILFFGLVALLASLGSGGGFNLLIGVQFVSIVSIPLFVFLLARNRRLVYLCSVFLVVLSTPSIFGLTYHQISTISVYPDEIMTASYFLQHQQGSLTLATDPKTWGIVISESPTYSLVYYTEPLDDYPYYHQFYNVVYLPFSNYQLHLYGYAPTYGVVYHNDVVYSNGWSFILPPIS